MKLAIYAEAHTNIYAIVNVLAVAQHFWWCFDAIKVEVRAYGKEAKLGVCAEFELGTVLDIHTWHKEITQTNAVSVRIITYLFAISKTYCRAVFRDK